MNGNRIKVLLIEDNPGDARLIREMLADTGRINLDLECNDRLSAGLERINRGGIDIVLLDLSLPDSKGLETFNAINTQTPGVPIIVLTGLDDEEIALKAVQGGAQDYLVKGNVDSNLLVRSIRYAIERKQTEEALKESEEKFRVMSSAANDAIVMLDNEGMVVYWNKAAEKIFGFTEQEILGKDFHQYIVPIKYHEAFKRGFPQFQTSGRGAALGKTLELTGLNKERLEFPVELSLSAVKMKGKWNAIGTIRDITERKRAEEELIRSEKLAGIGTLASGIAHEINNPLAGITGYAEIIIDQDNSELTEQYAKKIVDQAHRAADIVKWLSRYSKQSKDGNVTEVDMHKVIEDSLEALKHTRKSGDIEIIKQFRGIPKISGNQSELQQVFVNLLNNAVDALADNGRIGFSTSVNKGMVEVKVSDNGVGIAERDLSQIFNPFFTTKEVGKGTGLGLYVSSMIVKKHHGTIEVASEEGKGTTFTMRFPKSGDMK